MSDILADIDDTLADWHGSRDSMRWRPDSGPVTAASYLQGIRDVLSQSTNTLPLVQAAPEWNLEPDVWPHRDYILDLHGISLTPGMVVLVDGITEAERLRIIEGPLRGPWRVRPVPERPRRLDARYRQRQKNRRKRRR